LNKTIQIAPVRKSAEGGDTVLSFAHRGFKHARAHPTPRSISRASLRH